MIDRVICVSLESRSKRSLDLHSDCVARIFSTVFLLIDTLLKMYNVSDRFRYYINFSCFAGILISQRDFKPGL